MDNFTYQLELADNTNSQLSTLTVNYPYYQQLYWPWSYTWPSWPYPQLADCQRCSTPDSRVQHPNGYCPKAPCPTCGHKKGK